MRRVFISDDRNPAARSTAARLAELGYGVTLADFGGGGDVPGCERVLLDTGDLGAMTAFFAGWGGELHGVIHPAPPPVQATIEHCDEDTWAAAYRDGPLTALTVTRAAAEEMAKHGRGSLVFLGSMHAEKPMGNGFLYSMTCAATQMLCREAALDYASKGVYSYYVRLGVLEHEIQYDNAFSNQYSGVRYRYPSREIPPAGAFNELIAFLLTDGARPLNGSDVNADEGYTLFYGIQREAQHG